METSHAVYLNNSGLEANPTSHHFFFFSFSLIHSFIGRGYLSHGRTECLERFAGDSEGALTGQSQTRVSSGAGRAKIMSLCQLLSHGERVAPAKRGASGSWPSSLWLEILRDDQGKKKDECEFFIECYLFLSAVIHEDTSGPEARKKLHNWHRQANVWWWGAVGGGPLSFLVLPLRTYIHRKCVRKLLHFIHFFASRVNSVQSEIPRFSFFFCCFLLTTFDILTLSFVHIS